MIMSDDLRSVHTWAAWRPSGSAPRSCLYTGCRSYCSNQMRINCAYVMRINCAYAAALPRQTFCAFTSTIAAVAARSEQHRSFDSQELHLGLGAAARREAARAA